MLRCIVRQLLWIVAVLFSISVITFGLAHAVPGGPFDREHTLPPEIIANLERYYGLDQPVWKQYVDYIGRIITRFAFRPVYSSPTRRVNDIFADHLPVSAQLGLLSRLIALGIGVPLGIVAALRQNSVWDYLGMAVAIFGVSVPNLCWGRC